MDMKIELKPIGYVRNGARQSQWGRAAGINWRERTARMKEHRGAVSEVVIDTGLTEALDGIDEFSHLVVLYWPHLLPPETRATTRVHPLGSPDFPEVGVFATQSPARPNPILTTTVHLLGREANVLRVTGLDALDGSPVLDIKPHAPGRGDTEGIRLPEWMHRIRRELGEPFE
jgi:tRNA-Thr(GGU) m(6)t(6)A37 methyltransferase TsaA